LNVSNGLAMELGCWQAGSRLCAAERDCSEAAWAKGKYVEDVGSYMQVRRGDYERSAGAIDLCTFRHIPHSAHSRCKLRLSDLKSVSHVRWIKSLTNRHYDVQSVLEDSIT
jgi:hypothetical protein